MQQMGTSFKTVAEFLCDIECPQICPGWISEDLLCQRLESWPIC